MSPDTRLTTIALVSDLVDALRAEEARLEQEHIAWCTPTLILSSHHRLQIAMLETTGATADTVRATVRASLHARDPGQAIAVMLGMAVGVAGVVASLAADWSAAVVALVVGLGQTYRVAKREHARAEEEVASVMSRLDLADRERQRRSGRLDRFAYPCTHVEQQRHLWERRASWTALWRELGSELRHHLEGVAEQKQQQVEALERRLEVEPRKGPQR